MRSAYVMVFVAFLGCNDHHSGSLATYDDYVNAAFPASCDYYSRCGYFSPSQKSTCVSWLMHSYQSSMAVYSVTEALSSGRIAYDSASAQQCLDLLNHSGCDVTSLLSLGASSPCLKVMQPKVAPGGACKSSSECVGGYCDQGSASSSGCPGTCKAFAATGASCSNAECDSLKDYCDFMSQVCVARGTQGAACDTSHPCVFGLSCRASTTGGPTTCQGPAAENEPCASTFFASPCMSGLYCDAVSSTCKKQLAAGGACTSKEACQDGLTCAGGTTTTGGTCQAYLDIGQTCTGTTLDSACCSDAECDQTSHTCKLAGQLGADCSTSSCGVQYYCNRTTNQCASPSAIGEACDPTAGSQVCLEGSCDTTSKTCKLVCM